jgi:hypothetical protein
MSFFLNNTLPDGSTVVVDSADGVKIVLKPGQWEQVLALPHDQQRAKVDELVAANAADPTGGRSEVDEQTMDSARDSSSGEAHADRASNESG